MRTVRAACSAQRRRAARARHTPLVRLRRDERGVGAVEFILIMPVVMVIFLLLVQWSVQIYNDRIVHAAAREAAVDAAAWQGSAEDGRRTANDYLADTGSDLSGVKITIRRGATQASASVSGHVITLVPGFRTTVSATETAPRERFAE